jgi:hypothetical protein
MQDHLTVGLDSLFQKNPIINPEKEPFSQVYLAFKQGFGSVKF